MGWKECNRMSQRNEFVLFAEKESSNIALLCRRYGISRKTGYKWLSRYVADGVSGLQDRSRRPRLNPNKTSQEMEERILSVRAAHPWCGRKIHGYLASKGIQDIPAPSTITSILRRQGCIAPKQSEAATPWTRFERPEPNDLWQADFKGHFAMEQQRCHPLTVVDDHSRFCTCLQACADEKRDTVKQSLIEVFMQYGLPRQMNFDNGPPWGNEQVREEGFTQFSLWLIRLGITVSFSAPMHPQTNGKDERFHRTLKAEVLQGRVFRDLSHAQRVFDQWRPIYNFERPHDALGNVAPASRYRPSTQSYPGLLPPIEYAPGDHIRKVDQTGSISFQGRSARITKALKGEPVAIRPTLTDGVFEVIYVRQRIKTIDLRIVPS